jgi:large subunit ribosomal protein L9
MKVILLQNVKKIGSKGAVVEVSSGYAQNFLFPQKKAAPATDMIMSKLSAEQVVKAKQQADKEQAFKNLFVKIADEIIEINQKVNDKGGLYKALDTQHIAQLLTEKFGLPFENRFIALEHAIKESGTYVLDLDALGVKGKITLIIKGE